VYIAPSASVTRSVIGPHVSIAEGARIDRSIVSDSIIDTGAHVDSTVLRESLVGSGAHVRGQSSKVNIGDDCTVDLA